MYFLWKVLFILIIVTESKEYVVREGPVQSQPIEICDKNNKLCFLTDIGDDIQLIDDKIIFPEDSIFFIEDSCNGGLDLHQACSIESAARLHPTRNINVLFLGPVTAISLSTSLSWEILKYKNVKIYRVNVQQFLKDTPLENIHREQRQCLVRTLSDVLIFLTLYKYGGIYLSLDVLLLKKLELLPQTVLWTGSIDDKTVGAGLLALPKYGTGHIIADRAITNFIENYEVGNYMEDATDVLTNVLERICGTKYVSKMLPKYCKGISVYEPSYFYPIHYSDWRTIYDGTDFVVPTKSFAIYIWHSQYRELEVSEGSLYSYLMIKYCPLIKNVTNQMTGYIVE